MLVIFYEASFWFQTFEYFQPGSITFPELSMLTNNSYLTNSRSHDYDIYATDSRVHITFEGYSSYSCYKLRVKVWLPIDFLHTLVLFCLIFNLLCSKYFNLHAIICISASRCLEKGINQTLCILHCFDKVNVSFCFSWSCQR